MQSGVVILSGAVMGCCLGFLVFNLPPARVFMGDSGSHFLGVALGVITILGVAKIVVGLSILVPLIALGLPIGDTAFAIVRRTLAGRNPAAPDAGHLHHRLRAVGMTPDRDRGNLLSGDRDPRLPGAHDLRPPPDHRCRARAAWSWRWLCSIWRNRRRVPRLPFAPVEESEVQVDGHRALPSHVHHRGEVD